MDKKKPASRDSEQENQMNEIDYRSFVNHSPDIIYLFSTKKGGLFWSDRIKDILGYLPDELKEDPFAWNNAIHPDDKPMFDKAIKNSEKGNNNIIEYRIRRKDGRWIWLKDTFMHKTWVGDEIVIEGHATDITTLKETERKLKESELRWYFSVDGSGLGLWDWIVPSGEVFFSQQWKKMLGFKDDEISGSLEEWEKRVHPEDKEQVFADINAHFEGKTSMYTNEHRVLCKDGNYKWILDRGKIVERTPEGKPYRIIGTHTDIDEQKKLQQAFVDYHARFRFLFEQSPIGIYIADKTGNIIDGNQKLLDLLGSPSLEATKQINVLTYPSLVENGYADKFRKCVETGERQEVELFYTSKWNITGYLFSYIVPLYNKKGELEHIYTLMEDITQRKKMEEELIAKNKELESLNNTKDRIFSIIAHDLRGPVITMMQTSEMVSEKDHYELDNEELNYLLDTQKKLGVSTYHLLENLLNWARFNLEQIQYNPKLFDLKDIIDENLVIIGFRAKQKDIQVNFDSPGSYEVYADVELVKLVVRNIIENAIKFTETKGQVTIRLEKKPGFVVTKIADTGVGIPEEDIQKILSDNEFHTKTGTDNEKGAGLGLKLAKYFITRNKGELLIRSETGKGSEFSFTLPVEKI